MLCEARGLGWRFAGSITIGVGCVVVMLSAVEYLSAQKPRVMDQALRAEMLDLAGIADEHLDDHYVAADESVSYQCHYMRGPLFTYVPCAVDILGHEFRDSAMYVRAMRRNDHGAVEELKVPDPTFESDRFATGIFYWSSENKVSYPVEDVHFVEAPPVRDGMQRFARGLMLRPGPYDIFIVIRERPYVAGERQIMVIRHPVDVPDFRDGRLSVGSIVAIEEVRRLPEPLSDREQIERPFALGSVELIPAQSSTFREAEELRVVLPIYNATADSAGKPTVAVHYEIELAGRPDLVVARLPTDRLDADTLPTDFDLDVAGGLFVRQSVPLDTLGRGDFRLQVRVNDERSGQSTGASLEFQVR